MLNRFVRELVVLKVERHYRVLCLLKGLSYDSNTLILKEVLAEINLGNRQCDQSFSFGMFFEYLCKSFREVQGHTLL